VDGGTRPLMGAGCAASRGLGRRSLETNEPVTGRSPSIVAVVFLPPSVAALSPHSPAESLLQWW
jgi:hypothetical protein